MPRMLPLSRYRPTPLLHAAFVAAYYTDRRYFSMSFYAIFCHGNMVRDAAATLTPPYVFECCCLDITFMMPCAMLRHAHGAIATPLRYDDAHCHHFFDFTPHTPPAMPLLLFFSAALRFYATLP